MYSLKLCCLFIIWKHYGSLRHLYVSYEKSKIKHIYDSLDAILPNVYRHQCLETIRNGRSSFFTFLLSTTSGKLNQKIEKAAMLMHCQTNVSFLGDALFGYLNANSINNIDVKEDKDNVINLPNMHQYLLRNNIYKMMVGGSYIGNLSDTVHMEVSTGINTLLLNVRNRKNEIDFLTKQIQLEINHIIALIASYLYFCLWSFQFIFFFF